jgi:hypothetical protein
MPWPVASSAVPSVGSALSPSSMLAIDLATAAGLKSRARIEKLLDQLAEGGADEAAKRHLIPNRVVAKGGSAAPDRVQCGRVALHQRSMPCWHWFVDHKVLV